MVIFNCYIFILIVYKVRIDTYICHSIQFYLICNDDCRNNVAGESALDRLACNLGGKTMLPHILTNVPPMLQSENWKFRHAALMAISSCGEGCHKQMLQMLPDILESILPFLNDEVFSRKCI